MAYNNNVLDIIECPKCHIDIHEDIDFEEARRNLKIDEYTCPKCKGDIVISHDRKIYLVTRNKAYDNILYISFLLFVFGVIISLTMGDLKIKKDKLDNIILFLLFSPVLLGLGAQILQGVSNGVINFKYEFYRAKNPKIFSIILVFSVLVWISITYMFFDLAK